MKVKVVLDLNISQRKVLQKLIGKSKGITPGEYREALTELISDHLRKEIQKQWIRKTVEPADEVLI